MGIYPGGFIRAKIGLIVPVQGGLSYPSKIEGNFGPQKFSKIGKKLKKKNSLIALKFYP